MSEIVKLRTRIKNASAKSSEYRMTMTEARGLIKEIDQLIAQRDAAPKVVVEEKIVYKEVEVSAKILDGGTF